MKNTGKMDKTDETIKRAWSNLAGGMFNAYIRIHAIKNLVENIKENKIIYETTDGSLQYGK